MLIFIHMVIIILVIKVHSFKFDFDHLFFIKKTVKFVICLISYYLRTQLKL